MKNALKLMNLKTDMFMGIKMYEYKDIKFGFERVNNDLYGNPVYRIQIFDNDFNNITKDYKGKLGRYYQKNEFLRVQSYNIERTLYSILEG